MSKEDKQFFDGLLLGSILVGIVLVVLILYAFYRNPQPLGEYAERESQDNTELLIENIDNLESEEEDKEEETIQQDPLEIVSLLYNDTRYIVLTEIEHPEKDFTYRLLAEDTAIHRKQILDIRASNDQATCLGLFSGFGLPVLSIWDQAGERLVVAEPNIQEKLTNKSMCPVVKRWYKDKLIIQSISADAGISKNYIYSYDINGKVLEMSRSFGRYDYENPEAHAQYTSWSNGETTFVQYIAKDYSNSIIQPRNFIDAFSIPDLENGTLVLETNLEAKVDLLSDYNLTNWTKGLEYIIGGESIVLPWIVK